MADKENVWVFLKPNCKLYCMYNEIIVLHCGSNGYEKLWLFWNDPALQGHWFYFSPAQPSKNALKKAQKEAEKAAKKAQRKSEQQQNDAVSEVSF